MRTARAVASATSNNVERIVKIFDAVFSRLPVLL